MRRRPPRSPPFPYPTLSRPLGQQAERLAGDALGDEDAARRDRVADHRGAADPMTVRADLDRVPVADPQPLRVRRRDRKSTRLNSSHANISYAVFCLKKQEDT